MTRSAGRFPSQVSVEAPPPYTEASSDVQALGRPSKDSVTPSTTAETSRDATADVPPGVHLVKAPYKLRHKNSSIIRDFLVFDGDPINPFVPDITLRTKNALLHSRVYINAQEWGRPVSIFARTKNSDLILGIVSVLVYFASFSSMANCHVNSTRCKLTRLFVCDPLLRTVRSCDSSSIRSV